MLLSAVSIGSSFAYSPTQGHVIGLMAALTVIHALINSLSTAWLHRLARLYGIFHIGNLLAVAISLLVLQKNKHTAKYVFTNVEPESGWSPPGFSFLFGCLSVAWIMTNCDATAR
jgi:amino acid transporter